MWAYFNQANPSAAEAVPATVDPALIRQAVAEVLDLATLRQEVEAAIRGSFPRQAAIPVAGPEEDEAEGCDWSDPLHLRRTKKCY